MNQLATATPVESFGRYLLHPPIARGGMATVHPARLVASGGVSRLVAAKRLHPELTEDPDFIEMFQDEARIASRIHHPNVVPVLDVILSGQEVILVQEYVHGVPLSHLLKVAIAEGEAIPAEVVVAILTGVLAGLHAAHEATDEHGDPLGIVHRDVSPQNVLVSVDGVPRLLDFGIAKARTSSHHTREGILKGKLAYMSPEQLRSERVSRRADVYAAGVVTWELLTNRRFHEGKTDLELVASVAKGGAPRVLDVLADVFLSGERSAQLSALEPIVARAMSTPAEARYATAAEMAEAMLAACPAATSIEVAAWVRVAGADYLDKRQKILASNEASWRRASLPPAPAPARAPSSGTSAPEASGVQLVASEAPVAASRDATAWPRALPYPRGLAAGALRAALAAALVIVGVLLGMTAVKARGGESVASAAAAQGAAAPGPAEATGAPFASMAVASARIPAVRLAASPDPAAPEGALASAPAQRPPSPPPPATVTTVVRYVAVAARAAPLSPASATTPAPPSPSVAAPAVAVAASASAVRGDCNPPFYFEGPRKVFKPSCL